MEATGIYRNIFEQSCMINNDEYIIYTDKAIHWEKIPNELKSFGRLVISRPIFKEEGFNIVQNDVPKTIRDIYVGLKYSVWDSRYDGMDSKLTLAIDSVFRFKKQLEFNELFKRTPSQLIAHILGNQYYDCMSGGCSRYLLEILWLLAQDERIDKKTEVYPNGEKEWITIGDFLEEMKKKFAKDKMLLTMPMVQELIGKS